MKDDLKWNKELSDDENIANVKEALAKVEVANKAESHEKAARAVDFAVADLKGGAYMSVAFDEGAETLSITDKQKNVVKTYAFNELSVKDAGDGKFSVDLSSVQTEINGFNKDAQDLIKYRENYNQVLGKINAKIKNNETDISKLKEELVPLKKELDRLNGIPKNSLNTLDDLEESFVMDVKGSREVITPEDIIRGMVAPPKDTQDLANRAYTMAFSKSKNRVDNLKTFLNDPSSGNKADYFDAEGQWKIGGYEAMNAKYQTYLNNLPDPYASQKANQRGLIASTEGNISTEKVTLEQNKMALAKHEKTKK